MFSILRAQGSGRIDQVMGTFNVGLQVGGLGELLVHLQYSTAKICFILYVQVCRLDVCFSEVCNF